MTGRLVLSLTSGRVQRILVSADNGATFEAMGTIEIPIGSSIHGTGLVELADGTLLLSAAVRYSGDFLSGDQHTFHMDDVVYRSLDTGHTWQRLSSCARTDLAGTFGGIWEPNLHVDDAGDVVCTWSDETDQPLHSQTIRQAVSSDGGATWGTTETTVRLGLPGLRPGMPTTARMGDGTWAMSYEICGEPLRCVVHVRFSDDGRVWGDPSDPGQMVIAVDGTFPISAPVVAWSPAGGPQGTLVLTANSWQRPILAPDGYSSALMAVNTTGGRGPWHIVRSPIDPAQSTTCRHYSTPVFPLDSTGQLLEVEVGLAVDSTCTTFVGGGTLPSARP